MSQIISLDSFLLLLCDLKQALKAAWDKTALSKKYMEAAESKNPFKYTYI